MPTLDSHLICKKHYLLLEIKKRQFEFLKLPFFYFYTTLSYNKSNFIPCAKGCLESTGARLRRVPTCFIKQMKAFVTRVEKRLLSAFVLPQIYLFCKYDSTKTNF